MTTRSHPARDVQATTARRHGDSSCPSQPVDYEALYQQAPCGYLTTGDDGTITGVNDTFLHWTGHRRTDLLGTRLQTLMPVGDQILYSTHCTPQLKLAGAVAELLIEVTSADGARRPALLSASRTPAGDRADATVRVIIFSANERRRYEQELVAALRRAEESEARRVSAEADLAHQALHDPLTGLPNRAGLTAHLAGALARRPDTGTGLGVLVVHLDHFRAVNDSLGHVAGEQLLTVVASRLRATVRDSGTVARLSDDEFAVVDDARNAGQAARLAERLLGAVNTPLTLDGLEIHVTGNIGAVVVADDGDDTPDLLLRRADIAVSRAKARGPGRWEVHDPSREDPAADRLRLLGELRQGIERGQLRLHYQPRMDLRTGRVSGVEALVRWEHPTRGLLVPDAFIEVAEQSGLIRDLGAWVLEHAVAQAASWRSADPGRPPIEMAVNLSARQLGDPGLVAMVTDVLSRYGLDPALLTLEITETALMDDPDAALRTLTELRDLGTLLAIDDFGTGYASLTYLQTFPLHELKIDCSFVAGLGADAGDSAIVTSCVQLAHAVGLRAVAEGVETDRQRAALLELGCDLAQGYYYSRPLPAGDLARWLVSHRGPPVVEPDEVDLVRPGGRPAGRPRRRAGGPPARSDDVPSA